MAASKPNNELAIRITGLTKRYPGSISNALTDLNLDINSGEIYGFLGPNGAGKTTTIRLLMNFIRPTGGSAQILGLDTVIDSVEIKKSLGYLSSDITLYPKMTGHQLLSYMHDLQPAQSKRLINDLAKRLNADLNKKIGDLSRGNRQKISIIQAFMHQPKILILDEPSSGLDPLMQEEFYELLLESKQAGATVFISSHILGEVQKVCDRIGIIREGKLVAERSITDMAHEAAQTFDITFSHKPPLAELKKIKGVHIANHNAASVTVNIHGELKPLLNLLSKQNVTRLEGRSLDLEELFLRYYQIGERK